MQNLQTNEALLQHFQVEELEERLENRWKVSIAPSITCIQKFPDTGETGVFRKDAGCPPGWVEL